MPPHVTFAQGGLVFVPFMVGPISTILEFMSSTLDEFQLPNRIPTIALRFAQELRYDATVLRSRALPA